MSICITESLCCTAETNTTLEINYTPIKIFTKRNRLTDIENKLLVTKGEGGGGINYEFEISRYKLLYIK